LLTEPFSIRIAIILTVVGVLCITSLPVAQYPSIAPPSISVTATYPGASAKTLEDSDVSTDGKLSAADLGDFSVGTIQDPISRLIPTSSTNTSLPPPTP